MNATRLPDRPNRSVPSPLQGQDELDLLKQIVLFSEEDERALHTVWRTLANQTDDYLDVLLGLIAAHPPLLDALAGLDGEAPGASIDTARARFRQWIFDTCKSPYDQDWLDRLYGLLEDHPHQQGLTDRTGARPVGFRYLNAFIYPLITTIHPFLANQGHSAENLEQMRQAWTKSIILQATLLSKAYTRENEW